MQFKNQWVMLQQLCLSSLQAIIYIVYQCLYLYCIAFGKAQNDFNYIWMDGKIVSIFLSARKIVFLSRTPITTIIGSNPCAVISCVTKA